MSARRHQRRGAAAEPAAAPKVAAARPSLPPGPRASLLRQSWLLLRMDLLSELRTLETPLTLLFFAFLQVVIFTFSFWTSEETARLVAPGVLWVTLTFAGTLAIDRSFAKEQDGRTLTALRLVPGAGRALYIAKLLTNQAFLTLVVLFATPLVLLVLGVPLEASQLPLLALGLLLGTAGFAALGTVFSAMLVTVRRRGVLLPIILYPVAIPLLVIGVKATATLLDRRPDPEVWSWLRLMVAIDVLYVVAGAWLFNSTLSDE